MAPALLAAQNQPRGLDLGDRVAGLLAANQHRVPGARARSRRRTRRRTSSPRPRAVEVLARPDRLRRVAQEGRVEAGGALEQLLQPRARLALLLGARVLLLALELDPVAVGQRLDRVGEREPLLLLDELDHVAAHPAAEAVVELLLRVDRERRRALVVKRAQAGEAGARAAQVGVGGDDLDDVGGLLDPLDAVASEAAHDPSIRATRPAVARGPPAGAQDQIGEPDRDREDRAVPSRASDAERDQRSRQIERQLHRETGQEHTDPDPARPRVEPHPFRILAPGAPATLERLHDHADQRPADGDRDDVRRRVGRVQQQPRQEEVLGLAGSIGDEGGQRDTRKSGERELQRLAAQQAHDSQSAVRRRPRPTRPARRPGLPPCKRRRRRAPAAPSPRPRARRPAPGADRPDPARRVSGAQSPFRGATPPAAPGA